MVSRYNVEHDATSRSSRTSHRRLLRRRFVIFGRSRGNAVIESPTSILSVLYPWAGYTLPETNGISIKRLGYILEMATGIGVIRNSSTEKTYEEHRQWLNACRIISRKLQGTSVSYTTGPLGKVLVRNWESENETGVSVVSVCLSLVNHSHVDRLSHRGLFASFSGGTFHARSQRPRREHVLAGCAL